MKWHWAILFIGLVLYVFALVPGLLPHASDSVVAILAGATVAAVALFGFDTTHVSRRLATLMIILSLIMLIAGTALARQGHVKLLLLLSLPAVGLGLLGARKLVHKREKNE